MFMVNPCWVHKKAALGETKRERQPHTRYVTAFEKNLRKNGSRRLISPTSVRPTQDRADRRANAVHVPAIGCLDPHQRATAPRHIPMWVGLSPERNRIDLTLAREQSRRCRHLHCRVCSARRAKGNYRSQKTCSHQRLEHPKKLLGSAALKADLHRQTPARRWRSLQTAPRLVHTINSSLPTPSAEKQPMPRVLRSVVSIWRQVWLPGPIFRRSRPPGQPNPVNGDTHPAGTGSQQPEPMARLPRQVWRRVGYLEASASGFRRSRRCARPSA